jgi:hypothetical protein
LPLVEPVGFGQAREAASRVAAAEHPQPPTVDQEAAGMQSHRAQPGPGGDLDQAEGFPPRVGFHGQDLDVGRIGGQFRAQLRPRRIRHGQ